MTTTIAELLRRNVLDVFNERDPMKLRGAIEALHAPDSVLVDPEGSHAGWDGIETGTAKLQAATPGFVFSIRMEPQVAGTAGRIGWAYGPPEEPARIIGTDFITAREGKITGLYTFLDSKA